MQSREGTVDINHRETIGSIILIAIFITCMQDVCGRRLRSRIDVREFDLDLVDDLSRKTLIVVINFFFFSFFFLNTVKVATSYSIRQLEQDLFISRRKKERERKKDEKKKGICPE